MWKLHTDTQVGLGFPHTDSDVTGQSLQQGAQLRCQERVGAGTGRGVGRERHTSMWIGAAVQDEGGFGIEPLRVWPVAATAAVLCGVCRDGERRQAIGGGDAPRFRLAFHIGDVKAVWPGVQYPNQNSLRIFDRRPVTSEWSTTGRGQPPRQDRGCWSWR